MNRAACLFVVLLALTSCSGRGVALSGRGVALNERVLTADTLQLKSGGCTHYELGGDARGGSAGGAVGGGALVIRQSLEGDGVLVSVELGGTPIVERTYDEAFFESGRLDEFQVPPVRPDGALLLRFWGAVDPQDCAPLSQNGPTPN